MRTPHTLATLHHVKKTRLRIVPASLFKIGHSIFQFRPLGVKTGQYQAAYMKGVGNFARITVALKIFSKAHP
jgi:hypothetical protein